MAGRGRIGRHNPCCGLSWLCILGNCSASSGPPIGPTVGEPSASNYAPRLPLILTTARWDQRIGLQRVQAALAIAVIAACGSCLWMGLQKSGELQPRDWSPFISHIRFSLVITFAWGWWLIRYFKDREPLALLVVGLITLLGGWFTWKVASLTGAILFPLTLLVASWQFQRLRKAVLGLCVAGIAAAGAVAGAWFRSTRQRMHWKSQRPEARRTSTISRTVLARKRDPRLGSHRLELFEAWSSRSAVDFNGQDSRSQELKMTLIRFLTSKGLKKDADGVRALSDEEVQWMEGHPDHLGKNPPRPAAAARCHPVRSVECTGRRQSQRAFAGAAVAFLDAARHIYQQHPVLGVGIGDLPSSYDEAYRALNSPLDEAFRLRGAQSIRHVFGGGRTAEPHPVVGASGRPRPAQRTPRLPPPLQQPSCFWLSLPFLV